MSWDTLLCTHSSDGLLESQGFKLHPYAEKSKCLGSPDLSPNSRLIILTAYLIFLFGCWKDMSKSTSSKLNSRSSHIKLPMYSLSYLCGWPWHLIFCLNKNPGITLDSFFSHGLYVEKHNLSILHHLCCYYPGPSTITFHLDCWSRLLTLLPPLLASSTLFSVQQPEGPCWNLNQSTVIQGFPDSSVGKESACNAGDPGLIPGLGRSPGEGKGYPLQYSGLENSMDCIVPGVAKSWTWPSDFHLT